MPIRMAVLEKNTDNKCWRRCRAGGTLLHCRWERKLAEPLWKTVWRFLRKLKLELPYDPALPLLGIHLKKTNTNLKRYAHPSVRSSIIYSCRDMEAT